jgi:hypothetical protein
VETVVEQNRSEIIRREDLGEGARVEDYLRAWRLPDDVRCEILATALERAQQNESGGDLIRAVMEEVEKEARGQFEKMGQLPPLVPQRPPETHPMTMETSLNHLPSFRMIAGWFVIIALIVLTFIFTR